MKARTNSRLRLYRYLYFSYLMLMLIMVSGCESMAGMQSGSQATIETATAANIDNSSATALVLAVETNTPAKEGPENQNGTPTIEQAMQAESTSVSPSLRTSTPGADGTAYGEPSHSPASSPSPTREPKATAIPVPTLTDSEESELLSSLMLSNGDCELPCWWGIEPGITTEQDAWDLIESYGLQWVNSEDFRIIHLGYPRDRGNLVSTAITTHLWIDDGTVKLIEVEGGYRQKGLSEAFEREWQAFSPAAIVGRFGRPELVEFGEIGNSPYYQLTLAYDSSGVQMTYILPFTVIEEDKRQICFGLDTTDYLYPMLYQPHQSDALPYELLVHRQETYVSWEETTGKTVDDFLAIVLGSGCVQVTPGRLLD